MMKMMDNCHTSGRHATPGTMHPGRDAPRAPFSRIAPLRGATRDHSPGATLSRALRARLWGDSIADLWVSR